ncbi:MAG: hypothetical protein A3F67_06525 [Verrucomicrobia bacterium RIFCSPHIGHO2_12_FULL_41_10]|nr:MAG: hypothetical protein A3F67_06525 [Verrucomicrobia bacterium RIFCSPHIGHO2_12_FULL_41_10]HLB34286.1 16S rRNA (uracil(1498)-N(3))-methyltransferase [Chthoniobacterales bacterium]
MSSHRFYLPPEQWLNTTPQLNASDTHHCTHVLRLKIGDEVLLFDGRGCEASAILQDLTKSKGGHVSLKIGAPRNTPPPQCQITLAQAIPKAKNMDLIIQKAVELRASRIIPLLSERTVVRYDGKVDAEHKRDRWQSIALEACKQSGQNWLPHVETPCKLDDFFAATDKNHLLLIASLQGDTQSIKEILAKTITLQDQIPSHITVMIGPEGDFTPIEDAMAKSVGYQGTHLGPIILRTETAALYCLSVLAHELY